MPTLPDGTEFTTDENGYINSVGGQPGNRIPGSGAVGGGRQTPGGNPVLDLNFVDYNSLVAPFVNFQEAFDFAERIGNENRDTYYSNLTSQRSRDAALGLVDTDIAGINRGLDALLPRARREGNVDTGVNTQRARQIDQFNFSRIPSFNTFNRQQVEQNNRFNRAEREKSIQAAGLDYRSRTNKILEQLSTQSEGRLSDPLLDTLITRTNRDRGADIGAASGISSFSGAGRNIQDLLDVNQRIGLALDAQKTLPGVLNNAQQILQPPEELLPTTKALPTNVPLNATNLGERIPIQSNISAGQAQQQIGTQATEYEVIPATTALSSKLNTEQFNETGRYNRDLTVLDRNQGQLTAQDSENLRGILQDKEDVRQQQALDAYNAGLDQRTQAAQLQAGAGLVGGLLTTAPGQAILGGAAGVIGGVGGAVLDTVGAGIDAVFGDGDGKVSIGGFDVTSQGVKDAWAGIFGGGSSGGGGGGSQPGTIRGQGGTYDIGTPDYATGNTFEYPGVSTGSSQGIEGGTGAGTGDSSAALDFFTKTAGPIGPQDAVTTLKAGAIASNYSNMTTPGKVESIGNLAVDIGVQKNLIPKENAPAVTGAVRGLATLGNSNASNTQRAGAVGSLTAAIGGTSFAGTINNPTSIGGVGVIGSTTLGDGSPGFTLEDGSTVPRSDLSQSATGLAAVNAYNVVTSNAPNETKLAALTSIGLDQAASQEIIGQVAAGNGMAALAVFNTGQNFSSMNPVQQAASLIQTGNAVYGAVANSTAGTTAVNTGASVFGATLPGGVGLGGITAGAYTGYNQFTGAKKIASGDASEMNFLEQGALFSLTGGASILPALSKITGIGGGGKSTGRQISDAWRKGGREMGILDADDNVTLADGSKFTMSDTGEKYVNVDGTERKSDQVDWGSKVARNTIPDAHLFAFATGLDPKAKAGSFDRIVSKTVNAATSNATTIEEAQANLRTMMKDVDPKVLGTKLETMRLTGKINEKDYNIYLSHMNKLFGTNFQPADKGKSRNALIRQLRGSKEKEAKKLLNQLIEV